MPYIVVPGRYASSASSAQPVSLYIALQVPARPPHAVYPIAKMRIAAPKRIAFALRLDEPPVSKVSVRPLSDEEGVDR